MKALCLEAPLRWSRIEAPAPDAPGPGEALVRVHQVGICGTDLGGYLGKMPFFSYPRIPGHELGVEVLAIGRHAVNRAALTADESCLIIGAGPIGLATLEFVKLTGARIIVLDVNEQRLAFCREVMGVKHTLPPSDKLEAELRDLTD